MVPKKKNAKLENLKRMMQKYGIETQGKQKNTKIELEKIRIEAEQAKLKF